MKKLFYLGFCLAVVMTLGCANITYPCITDNWGTGDLLVNTNGKAHIMETSQVGLLTGGKMYTQVSFVDQSATGAQKTSSFEFEGMPYQFHSDTYCNPDWTGCAWFTYDYQCGAAECTFYAPGGRLNLNCLLTSAIGLCNYSRSGECGRNLRTPYGMTWGELDAIMNGATENGSTLTFNINRANTQISVLGAGGRISALNLVGNTELKMNLQKAVSTVELGTSAAASLRKWANMPDHKGMLSITRNGVTRTFEFQGLAPERTLSTLLRLGL